MTSVVQHGRRRGSSKRVSSDEDVSRMIPPLDLRQVTVLSKADWLRIQDELNGTDKEKESLREVAKQREALHLQSQEVVKQWSNTIAGQWQKKMEAKQIRDEIEEERRKLVHQEEAEFQAQKRKETIEKAKTQLYYQTDRVKGLHSALLLTEVLKEREAQIELKQRIKSASKDVDKDFLAMWKTRDDEAVRQEEEKALQKKQERQAITEDLKLQIQKTKLERERQKSESKRDAEETQRRLELYQQEQRMEEERNEKQKRDLMLAHLEQLADREVTKEAEAKQQEAEEKQRKLFLSAKDKITKLRKDREKELFNEAQARRDWIMKKLAVTQQEKVDSEEQRVAKAVAEQEERKAQQQQEAEEKRAMMLEAITTHRELMRQEKEQRDKQARQSEKDALAAKKEADRIFTERQQQRAQQRKDDQRKLQDFNASLTAEKCARLQQLRREQQELEEKRAQLMAEEENHFLQYSQELIEAAAETQRNTFPLCKAVREGLGGGSGPVLSGVRSTSAPEATKVSAVIRQLINPQDVQKGKRRLGFME